MRYNKYFLCFFPRRSTISKLRHDDEKQKSGFGSKRNYSRLSLLNATNSFQFQRDYQQGGYRARRHWSLSDIPKTRMDIISDKRLNNGSDDLMDNGLTRR